MERNGDAYSGGVTAFRGGLLKREWGSTRFLCDSLPLHAAARAHALAREPTSSLPRTYRYTCASYSRCLRTIIMLS